MITIVSVYFILFLLGLFGNPLSDHDIPFSADGKPVLQSEMENKNFWYEEDGSIISSNRYLVNKKEYVRFIKTKNSNCEFEIIYDQDDGLTKCVSLEIITNPEIHPLDFFTKYESNLTSV